jgi:hypothetical protein
VLEIFVDLGCGTASLGVVSDISRHLVDVIVKCQNLY